MNKISVSIPEDFASTVNDIKLAILQARAKAAHLANSEALKLYFYVGSYISKKTRSAKWGSGAIDALSKRLQIELPGLRGFSASNIKNMRFIVLGSGHFKDGIGYMLEPVFIPDGTKLELFRMFYWYYICAAARSQWSYQTLLQHLQADDYHHIGALPNNFEKTLSPMALATRAVRSFRDEYLLELVNLDNADAIHDQDVDERMLSKSLVADVEKTIQALGGSDFCFMGREKRLIYADEEIFIDLLFYHRGFHSMVAVELKMGKFRASYLGQLALYLSALDKLEKKPDENPTIGLLLCEEMNKPFVQLAVQDISKPIGIATYKTLRSIPKPYKTLAPVIEGVRQVLAQAHDRENI